MTINVKKASNYYSSVVVCETVYWFGVYFMKAIMKIK